MKRVVVFVTVLIMGYLGVGGTTVASAAPPVLKAPRVKLVGTTINPGTYPGFYFVTATLRWKKVHGTDIYLVCSLFHGGHGPFTCNRVDASTKTYTVSYGDVPAQDSVSFLVQACYTNPNGDPVPGGCTFSTPIAVSVP